MLGDHPGGYLPKFDAGQTVSWTVNGQTVTASVSPSSRLLPTVPVGSSGLGVQIGDEVVTIRADLDPWSEVPEEPTVQGELPLGPEFLGALSGELKVNPSGGATYTVPITVPPGTAGMAPKLSLVYDSQRGNAIAGHGWELTGLSTIHRCPKNRVQDGRAKPVLNSYIDEFNHPGGQKDGLCIDGKRLFERVSNEWLPECGDDRSTGCYETEIKDFAVVTSDVMRETFKVTTKSGETRFYGRTDLSRVKLVRGSDEFDVPPDEDESRDVDLGARSSGQRLGKLLRRGVQRPHGGFHPAWPHRHEDQIHGTACRLRDERTGIVQRSASDGELREVHVRTAFRRRGPPGRPASALPPRNGPAESAPVDDCDESRHVRALVLAGRRSHVAEPPREYRLLRGCDVLERRRGRDCSSRLSHRGRHLRAATHHARRATAASLSRAARLRLGGRAISLRDRQQLSRTWSHRRGQRRAPVRKSVGRPRRRRPARFRRYVGARLSLGKHRLGLCPQRGLEVALAFVLWLGTRLEASTVFADVNGDGISNLITSTTDLGQPHPQAALRVWLNRINRRPSCVEAACWDDLGVSTPVVGTIDFRATTTGPARDSMVNMNGDGRADLAHVNPQNKFQVALWTGTSFTLAPEYERDWSSLVRLVNMNRDGLPDFLTGQAVPEDRTAGYINEGQVEPNEAVWSEPKVWAQDPSWAGATRLALGDIDGDGLHDRVSQPSSAAPCIPVNPTPVATPHISYATGQGFDDSDFPSAPGHAEAAFPFFPDNGQLCNGPFDHYTNFVAVANLNADGLANLIVSRPRSYSPQFRENPGKLLVNRGTGWRELDGDCKRRNPDNTRTPVNYCQPEDDCACEWAPRPISFTAVPETPTGRGSTHAVALGENFVDLDGDGVLDLVEHGPNQQRSWLNKFRPPVIEKFPNGLAQKTEVTYEVITTAAAQAPGGTYSNTETLEPGTQFLAAPLRVVATVSAEDGTGTGTMLTSRYRYERLRGNAIRGPQGFAATRVNVSIPGEADTVTLTKYAQAYPYTGLPTMVQRFKFDGNFGTPLTNTTTTYCDTPDGTNCTPPTGRAPGSEHGPRTSLFVYAKTIQDRTELHGGGPGANITVTSLYDYDGQGNPVVTLVQTAKVDGNGQNPEVYLRTTENEYADSGSREERLGKLTSSVVTTENAIEEVRTVRTTEFEYEEVSTFSLDGDEESTLALTKELIEPGLSEACAGGLFCQGVEVHTAYAYDRYGNVTTTTTCASDFDECEAGAANPSTPADPLDPDFILHPPFRSKTVSFDPAAFAPTTPGAVVALGYGDGRFPVRTDMVVGGATFTEFAAYDARHGGLVQKTDANGIHTCYTYDRFGQRRSEVARCTPDFIGVTTTTNRFLAMAGDPAGSKVVTVVRAPDGGVTWTFTGALAQEVGTRSRAFNGGFVETTTGYDALGSVTTQSKPHLPGRRESTPRRPSTMVWADRVSSSKTDLGIIDGVNDGTTVRSRRPTWVRPFGRPARSTA